MRGAVSATPTLTRELAKGHSCTEQLFAHRSFSGKCLCPTLSFVCRPSAVCVAISPLNSKVSFSTAVSHVYMQDSLSSTVFLLALALWKRIPQSKSHPICDYLPFLMHGSSQISSSGTITPDPPWNWAVHQSRCARAWS